MNIFNIIRAENIKTRKNLMFISFCLFPLFVNLFWSFFYCFSSYSNRDFWGYSLKNIFYFICFIFPTLIALVAYTYVNMESSNNCNKQLFCLPTPSYKIYLSKCLVLLYHYTLSIIIAYVSYILSIYLLKTFIPDINELLSAYDSRHLVDIFFIKTYIIILPIVFFQFAVSLTVKNIWFPTTLSLFLTVLGILKSNIEHFYFLPHLSLSHLLSEFYYNNISILDNVSYFCIGYTLLFIVLGYFSFQKK